MNNKSFFSVYLLRKESVAQKMFIIDTFWISESVTSLIVCFYCFIQQFNKTTTTVNKIRLFSLKRYFVLDLFQLKTFIYRFNSKSGWNCDKKYC